MIEHDEGKAAVRFGIALARLAQVSGAIVVCAFMARGLFAWREARAPTFAEDVAPIVMSKCAPCHRPGGAGPFSLLTYEDVADHSKQIREVTASRFMPPCKPAPGSGEYVNDRSLTAGQIDVIGRWVKSGAKRGDPAKDPTPPEWPVGWPLGPPDAVVELPEPYPLAADGTDVYRNFVIPSPVEAPRWVRAWDLHPGTRAMHHAIMNVDRYGLARKRDAEDPGPGFGGMDVGDVQSADGFYLVWTPGKTPASGGPDDAWRIDERTDLVLQLHMQPTGKPEIVKPTIGLYFTDRPPSRPSFSMRIGDGPIDIAPGEKNYRLSDETVVAAPVDVISLFPHAHYVAKRVHLWATPPTGGVRELLRIEDWDFNWQDEYVFQHPAFLPAGTKLEMEITYDNSASNVRNPNHPPKRVTSGESSTDEMGNVTLRVVPREPDAMNRLREAKYRRALGGADTAKNQYNLANVLADEKRVEEAVFHYRRAIELNPSLSPAHYNLATLLSSRGAVDAAIVEFRAAIATRPEFAGAYVNLGHALEAKGDRDQALKEYRRAVSVEPRDPLARGALGVALENRGSATAAIVELDASLSLDPDNWLTHYHLGNVLCAAGRTPEGLVHYKRALELKPDAPEPRAALAAYARGGG
jgi:tetratricopeptide (TPR) repeat protein